MRLTPIRPAELEHAVKSAIAHLPSLVSVVVSVYDYEIRLLRGGMRQRETAAYPFTEQKDSIF